MKEDRYRWNKRFSEREMVLGKTPLFIEERFSEVAPGSVLDIACGDGVAALYLADKGFEVTAVDVSDVALQRLESFANERGLDVCTYQADLDQSNSLDHLPQYDYIVMTHFKPKDEYWPIIISHLKPNGRLYLSTFNCLHHLKNNFSRRFCLEENELVNISKLLELEFHASVERDGSYMDDYQFQLTPS